MGFCNFTASSTGTNLTIGRTRLSMRRDVRHFSIDWSDRCHFRVPRHVFTRGWYGKITPRETTAIVACYFYCIHSRLAILKTSQETRKNVLSFFTMLDSILRARTTLPPSFECSLYATNRYRAFRFVLRLSTAYVILLFSQWYELSAKMTFQRDALVRCAAIE